MREHRSYSFNSILGLCVAVSGITFEKFQAPQVEHVQNANFLRQLKPAAPLRLPVLVASTPVPSLRG